MSDTRTWMFYHDGVYGPGTEQELRDFTKSLGVHSDEKGMASVVMQQQWDEIDALRAALKTHPVNTEGRDGLNITEIVQEACAEPTLVAALVYVAICETERAVKQARSSEQWDTCFGLTFTMLMDKWNTIHPPTSYILHAKAPPPEQATRGNGEKLEQAIAREPSTPVVLQATLNYVVDWPRLRRMAETGCYVDGSVIDFLSVETAEHPRDYIPLPYSAPEPPITNKQIDDAILAQCALTFTGENFRCQCRTTGQLIQGCQSQRSKMATILQAALYPQSIES